MQAAIAVHATGCAPTVEAALTRLLAQQASSGTEGYRVASVRRDALRGRTWAMVASCTAPAAPLMAFELPDSITDAINPVRVHMGEAVKVIRRGDGSQLELAGVAQQSGEVGQSIRVQIPRFSEDSSEAAPVIECRVLAAGVVEVVR
jgi:hypothetical protein